MTLLLAVMWPGLSAQAFTADTRVSVGSPTSPFSQNKQNEPALAVDANHPNILAAGANDNIDLEACNAGDPTTCPFTPGIGVSGIYFSLDSGDTWTQPAYTGLTARGCVGPAACTPTVGPIGTLPWYYENGLASGGDPALAFGPRIGGNGKFSWANGSRLYYANLSGNEGGSKGAEVVAVSRTDDVQAAAAGDKNAWMPPVVASKQNSQTFSDKEQIWADNAASSTFFGTVYICFADFRSHATHKNGNAPTPLTVLVSHDGGSSWSSNQLTPAGTDPNSNNASGFGISGCTVRTDSHGAAYIFGERFAPQTTLPTHSDHIMFKSADGGASWSHATALYGVVDPCFVIDPVIGRCVEDGVAGARNDLAASPSVDIANGAPTGAGATNEMLVTYVDGGDGLNHEHVVARGSTDGGASWSPPVDYEVSGDRGYYSAISISPGGTDAYLVYDAFTTPYRSNTSDPRGLVGVVLHASLGSDGAPVGNIDVLHRSPVGDPRGSSQNGLTAEFLGDYVYSIATPTYGAAVWNDTRNAADCPALDAWRQSLRDGTTVTKPAPQTDCAATFGNSDIFGGSYADPTP